MSVTGIPLSNADIAVHFPVPFYKNKRFCMPLYAYRRKKHDIKKIFLPGIKYITEAV